MSRGGCPAKCRLLQPAIFRAGDRRQRCRTHGIASFFLTPSGPLSGPLFPKVLVYLPPMDEPDELNDYWEDILPSPLPTPTRPPTSEVLPGFLWLGLLAAPGSHELATPGYKRLSVKVGPGPIYVFNARFTCHSPEGFSISGMGLFTTERGGEMLHNKSFAQLNLREADTIDLSFKLEDPAGNFGHYFRRTLVSYGILGSAP